MVTAIASVVTLRPLKINGICLTVLLTQGSLDAAVKILHPLHTIALLPTTMLGLSNDGLDVCLEAFIQEQRVPKGACIACSKH